MKNQKNPFRFYSVKWSLLLLLLLLLLQISQMSGFCFRHLLQHRSDQIMVRRLRATRVSLKRNGRLSRRAWQSLRALQVKACAIEMEAWAMMAKETELEEKKKVLSECKDRVKSADELVVAFVEGRADNLDDQTIKGLIEKSLSDVTQVLYQTQTLRSGGGGSGN